jgi:predicted kinase
MAKVSLNHDYSNSRSALVVLVGASGAGKSSFARRHFLSTEIVSSDFCRGLVCDDESSLEATTMRLNSFIFWRANGWRTEN